jgi:hypothetical protein
VEITRTEIRSARRCLIGKSREQLTVVKVATRRPQYRGHSSQDTTT